MSQKADLVKYVQAKQSKKQKAQDALANQFPGLFNSSKTKQESHARLPPSIKAVLPTNDYFVTANENVANNSINIESSATRVPFSTTSTPSAATAAATPSSVKKSTIRPISKQQMQTPSKIPTLSSSTPSSSSSSGIAISFPTTDKKQKRKNWLKGKASASKKALTNPEKALIAAEQGSVSVMSVLEVMLSEQEVDEITFKRLSSERFSIDALRRLSTSNIGNEDGTDDAVDRMEETEQAVMPLSLSPLQKRAEREEEIAEEVVAASSPVRMPTRPLGDLDVLSALRNYIKIMDADVVEEGGEENEAEEEEAMDEESEGDNVIASIPMESVVEEAEDIDISSSSSSSSSSAVAAVEEEESPAIVIHEKTDKEGEGEGERSPLAEQFEYALSAGEVSSVIRGRVERFGYVEFEILVTARSIQMMVLRRYSQFASLHATLLKECGRSLTLPILPGKQVLPSLNSRWKDPTFLINRQAQLEAYLSGVLAISSTVAPGARSAIREFFTSSTDISCDPALTNSKE